MCLVAVGVTLKGVLVPVEQTDRKQTRRRKGRMRQTLSHILCPPCVMASVLGFPVTLVESGAYEI